MLCRPSTNGCLFRILPMLVAFRARRSNAKKQRTVLGDHGFYVGVYGLCSSFGKEPTFTEQFSYMALNLRTDIKTHRAQTTSLSGQKYVDTDILPSIGSGAGRHRGMYRKRFTCSDATHHGRSAHGPLATNQSVARGERLPRRGDGIFWWKPRCNACLRLRTK